MGHGSVLCGSVGHESLPATHCLLCRILEVTAHILHRGEYSKRAAPDRELSLTSTIVSLKQRLFN